MIFPRMSALSEVLWSPKNQRDSMDFEKRLETQFKRYDLWGTNYSKAIYDLKTSVLATADFNGVLWKLESKDPATPITYIVDKTGEVKNYTQPIVVAQTEELNARSAHAQISQKFFINKATGKKITLTGPPARTYQGDGAFTLVNGIQNERGLDKPREFLGFNGTDCEAIIDLGSVQQISNVRAHVFEQTFSWIYRPKFFRVLISSDSTAYTEMGMTDLVSFNSNNQNGVMSVEQKSVAARYIKIKLGNYGMIPPNNPGAGSKAWLFVDEIEVN